LHRIDKRADTNAQITNLCNIFGGYYLVPGNISLKPLCLASCPWVPNPEPLSIAYRPSQDSSLHNSPIVNSWRSLSHFSSCPYNFYYFHALFLLLCIIRYDYEDCRCVCRMIGKSTVQSLKTSGRGASCLEQTPGQNSLRFTQGTAYTRTVPLSSKPTGWFLFDTILHGLGAL
jgi:hypothetical protein